MFPSRQALDVRRRERGRRKYEVSRNQNHLGGLIITLVAAVAVSQTVKRAHMHGGDSAWAGICSASSPILNLTDAQQAQIKEIMAKSGLPSNR